MDGVSLEVAEAERLSLLGPSGSGKSTLLRAIAGLEPLAAGRVEWNEADMSAVPVHRRGFGLMFQDYALLPHRDVEHNVAFGLSMQGVSVAETGRRVAEVLELVGLIGYERRGPTELSGGEQQRVALARALAPRPRLLMLDEPLGALDRSLRGRLLEQLSDLFAALRLPIIYVTHDQEEALTVGDRVAVMNGGRLETVMPPLELWRAPPNEFVARFLGFTNIATATVRGGRATTPWGTFEVAQGVADGEMRVLIRPDALSPDANGPLAAVVESRTFHGYYTKLRLRVADAAAPPLEVHADWADVPNPGEPVRLRVDPDGLVALPSEGAKVALEV